MVQSGEVVFAPDDGTWTLEGKAAGSTVEASRSRPSFDNKTFSTELKATLTDTQARGTYSTPTCSYAVNLTRF